MSLLWRSDVQCHGMGKWVHVGSQNNPWVALGVKDPWISFHRLQTLDEQACGDRCKALKARMGAWRCAEETRPPMNDLSTQLPSTSLHQSKNMFLSSPLQNCYSTAHFGRFLFSHLCRILLISKENQPFPK